MHVLAVKDSEAGLFKIYEVIAQDFLFPILICTSLLDNHDLGRFMQKEENLI